MSKPSESNTQIAYIGVANTTPLGPVSVAVSDKGLVAVMIETREQEFRQSIKQLGFENVVLDSTRVSKPVTQLSEYLVGKRREFDLLIDWSVVTPFQCEVLRLVSAIPYGRTSTYGEIASQLGRPNAARAVGRANATNPMPLVIPCHRVIGSDGKLRGYGAPGGLDTKAWLLRLESWH